ncbi:uncharacterized protein LOC122313971 isoform X3 [Carya illinoinensis]|uniref:uncharacterized protein LOC122313971 isoform X3 n=1 Tax=Carya illinoinensis TaxID=32201 RepID=UPI001C71D3C3|nr:uncharacterized protein LOC122313971 isoform X3 [Carya illinoinensis]
MATTIRSDIRSAMHMATSTFLSLSPKVLNSSRAAARSALPFSSSISSSFTAATTTSLSLRGFSSTNSVSDAVLKAPELPSICTADELHYVSVSSSDWKLALWRYHPSPQAPQRNHPLLLLSGVGTNAIGYDLSPEASYARYMSSQGFDTWILEVRGAGLSVQGVNSKEIKQSANKISEQMEAASRSATNGALPVGLQSTNGPGAMAEPDTFSVKGKESENVVVKGDMMRIATVWDESRLVMKLTETFMRLSERLSGFLSEGQSKIMFAKLSDQISKLLADSPFSERFNEIREKLSSLLETRQNSSIASQIRDLSQRIVNIIEEGQRSVSPPLFDLQERFASTIEDFQKQLDLIVKYDWDFDNYLEEDVPAAMEYIRSKSRPKDGKLLAIGHSMGGILLYATLSRCGTIPAKLLLQLTTAFREGGLHDRSGTFSYKDHIHKSNIPILALAGDRDLICPPEAVLDTVKLIPEHLVTYKVFGEPGGPHYAHYDLVGGRLAVEQVYPRVIQFLARHDST